MNNEVKEYFININKGCNKLFDDLMTLKDNVKYLNEALPSKDIEKFTSDVKNTIEVIAILTKQLQDKNLEKFKEIR